MVVSDDSVRIQQTLYENCADKNHIFNRFVWGNKKSLKGKNKERLLSDLRSFFDNQYSADRMKLVIQVKTNDDISEVKEWVKSSMRIIENKSLGLQDYSKMDKYSSLTFSKMPFDGNENEMIVQTSFSDLNQLVLVFCLDRECTLYG